MSGDNSDKSLLSQWRQTKKKSTPRVELTVSERDQPAPVSHAQERLWILEKLFPNQSLYTYAHQYSIKGSADIEKIIEGFRSVVTRHEILRTTYFESDGKIFQRVLDKFTLEPSRIAFSDGAELARAVNEAIAEPFDLEKDLPIRLYLAETTDGFELLVVIHHIAGDALSMNIINREVSEYYHGNMSPEPLKFQFRDFANWDRKKPVNETHLNFWKDKLSGDLPVLELPKQRTALRKFDGRRLKKTFTPVQSENILAAASTHQVTPFVFLLTIFKVVLGRYMRDQDQVIGTPINTRDHPDLENSIGFFNETFVLRSKFDSSQTFTSALKRMNDVVLDSLSHKEVTFEQIVRAVQPNRAPGENPLFQAMFLYNEVGNVLNLGDETTIDETPLDTGVSKFDLTVFVNRNSHGLEMTFEYNAGFEDSFIERLSDHIVLLTEDAIQHPEKSLASLSLLSKKELAEIQAFNKTQWTPPQASSILNLIESHIQSSGSAIAGVANGNEISYSQLDINSNAIAAMLLERGVKKNEFVGLYTHRSLDMITGILGILKAGAAYLPLDPEYPSSRISFMIADTSCRIILVQAGISTDPLPDSISQLNLSNPEATEKAETLILNKPDAQDFAYVIYTSGSTGQPKGVAITHGQLLHSTTARFKFYDDQVDTFLLLSSFSFDSSIVGIFWTLCSGGTLILPPERIEQDIPQLSQLIENQQVTHTLLLPSLYQVILNLIEKEVLASLKVVMVAGEACPKSLVMDHFEKVPSARIYNEYGPTEASVWSIAQELLPDIESPVPIGTPIPNSQAYITDQDLNLMPIGLSGEIIIGGEGVANGYLNDTKNSESKFLPDQLGKGSRLYKTGDLGRINSNRAIEFLGRLDDQTKIRGFRVELGEIQACLLSIESVKDAFITIFDKEESKQLVAYVISENYDYQKIIERLTSNLPRHMIPTLVQVRDFPKLPNGKVDKSALPNPESQASSENYTPPVSSIEKTLVSIWEEVLGIEKIGIHDNYFEIGGDSILSIQIISKARDKDLLLEPTSILRHQTVQKLAKSISSHSDTEEDWSSVIPMKTSGDRPPLFCIHSGGAHVMFYRDFAQEMAEETPVYAIQPKGLGVKESFHKTISEMAASYIQAIKRIQPSGPYHLLGSCFSNAVGIEMIHQLSAQNERVGKLIIVDSAPAFLTPPFPNGERMPVRRMLKMLGNGDLTGVYKKFKNRYIRLSRKLKTTTEIEKDLDEMIDSLNSLYAQYNWSPVDCRIELIRSSEFASRPSKKFHLERWTTLSKGNLEVHEIDGHHLTLFKQPEVVGLARKVSQIMSVEEPVQA